MSYKIIGICLIKNEDIYINRIITNVIDFCDKIIVLDNCSTDNTAEIVKRIVDVNKKVEYNSIDSFIDAQNYVKAYAGTNTWIFGVDGDEIYDPSGLSSVREMLLEKKNSKLFRFKGYFLHAKSIDDKHVAQGYLAPPSKDPNKIYNFGLLKYWKTDGKMSLFHSQKRKFRSGYSSKSECLLYKKYKWNKCPLRCLHVRFLKRSTLESDEYVGKRLNPSNKTSPRWVMNLYNFREKYRVGKLKKIDVSSFFSKDLISIGDI
jgi:glycosyltransferase involved in cell wall biosynthesis